MDEQAQAYGVEDLFRLEYGKWYRRRYRRFCHDSFSETAVSHMGDQLSHLSLLQRAGYGASYNRQHDSRVPDIPVSVNLSGLPRA